MKDIIYREDAINLIEEIETKRLKGEIELAYAPTLKGLMLLPSADRTGKWIIQDGKVVCSECFEPNKETDFCPHCGADMRGESDE